MVFEDRDEAARSAAGDGTDRMLALAGESGFGDDLAPLRPEGRLVLVSLLAGGRAPLDPGNFLARQRSVAAVTMRSLSAHRRALVTKTFSRRYVPDFGVRRLRQVIGASCRFGDAARAHVELEADRVYGILVLSRRET